MADRIADFAGAEKYADSLRDCMVTTHTHVCMDEKCLHPSQAVTHCKQRLCSHCAPIKSKEQARGVRKLVSMFKTTKRESRPDRAKYSAPKFITLTMKTRPSGELSAALDELHRAKAKFPEWPTDPIHCAAIVGEESGELLRAALQWKYENGILDSLHEESVQTAAMSIRFINQLSKFKHHENP